MTRLIAGSAALLGVIAVPAQAQSLGTIINSVLGDGDYNGYQQSYQPVYEDQQSYDYSQSYAYQPAYGYQQSYGYQPAYGYQRTYSYQPRYVYSRPRYMSYGYRAPVTYRYPRYRYAAYRHHARRHHYRSYAYAASYRRSHRWG